MIFPESNEEQDLRDSVWRNDLSARARASFLQKMFSLPTVTTDEATTSGKAGAHTTDPNTKEKVALLPNGLDPGDPLEADAKKNFVLLVLNVTAVDYVDLKSNSRYGCTLSTDSLNLKCTCLF